jgi:hypothetical protein
MKKLFKILLIIIIIGAGFLAWYFLKPYNKVDLLYAIPNKPVFVIETDNSYDVWKKITKSEMWTNLKHHPFFSAISSGVDLLDSVIQNNEVLARYVGARDMLISMHITANNNYDFVYAIDLQRASKLLAAKDFVDRLIESKYHVKIEKYNNISVYLLADTATHKVLRAYFKYNLMVASYNQKLIEASIDQIDKPYLATDVNFSSIREQIKGDGLFRLYINYAQLDDYTNGMLSSPDPNIRQLSKSLLYTGLAFDLDNDNLVRCEGYTNYNDSIVSSLRAIARSGTGKTGLAEVLPMQTASTVSIGFDRFTDYFDNLMLNFKEIPKSYNEYQASIKKIESYLNIDVRKNIMGWIGDEAAMVQLLPMGLGRNNEFAVFLKTRDVKDAQENLDLVMTQIRKRTPVKFETVEYNGYNINYLSIKGFFRMLLGKYFQKLEKPYFTYIGDYVVFSNHPQTLKVIIDGISREKLLSNISDYKSFTKNFSRKSNVLMIVNTSKFLQSLQNIVTPSTWTGLEQNKEYIERFPYLGFQMENDGAVFKTSLYISFNESGSTQEEDNDIFGTTEIDTADAVVSTRATDEVAEMLKKIDDYIPSNVNIPSYTEKYENGQMKVEFELKDGFRDGEFKEYYDNGNIKIKGQYKNDHRIGTWKVYNEEGKLLQKIKY